MTPVRTIFALFLGLLLGVEPTTAAAASQGVPKQVLDVLSVFNGHYSNCIDKLGGVQSHDILQVKIMPIEVPLLGQGPMVYVEQATNGYVNILVLCSVTLGQDGIIVLTPHNLTNDTQHLKFGEYKIDSLALIKSGDFQTNNCTIVLTVRSADVYFMNWPDCSRTVNGQHPSFSIMLTCDSMTVIMPAGGSIKPALIPYELTRFEDRYSVPGAPIFYSSPCERKLLGLRIK